jgi:hypothetical protein
MPTGSSGGTATFGLGSLAAILARVLRGEVCRREGGFIAARRRGNQNEITWIKKRRSCSPRVRISDKGSRCRSGLTGGAHASVRKERGEGTDSGFLLNWATGRFPGLGQSLPRCNIPRFYQILGEIFCFYFA